MVLKKLVKNISQESISTESVRRKMKIRLRPTDIIFYLILAIILIWAILKTIGIIQSPIWLEMLPVFVAVFGAGIFYQKVMVIRDTVNDIKEEIKNLEKRISSIEKKID